MNINISSPKAEIVNWDSLKNKDFTIENRVYPNELLIEHVGRICYNSYDKMSPGSYVKFNSHGAKRGHRSMYEFGQLKISMKVTNSDYYDLIVQLHESGSYIKQTVNSIDNDKEYTYVSLYGSPRAFIELLEYIIDDSFTNIAIFIAIFEMLRELCLSFFTKWETYNTILNYYETYYHMAPYNQKYVKFSDITFDFKNPNEHTKIPVFIICNRSTSHEIVRHRPVSYLQLSQRYYRIKINDINVVLSTKQRQSFISKDIRFDEKLEYIFNEYFRLLRILPPEDAREILPNCTETRLFMYADKKEWRHFLRLRQSSAAFSTIREISDSIYKQFINKRIF